MALLRSPSLKLTLFILVSCCYTTSCHGKLQTRFVHPIDPLVERDLTKVVGGNILRLVLRGDTVLAAHRFTCHVGAEDDVWRDAAIRLVTPDGSVAVDELDYNAIHQKSPAQVSAGGPNFGCSGGWYEALLALPQLGLVSQELALAVAEPAQETVVAESIFAPATVVSSASRHELLSQTVIDDRATLFETALQNRLAKIQSAIETHFQQGVFVKIRSDGRYEVVGAAVAAGIIEEVRTTTLAIQEMVSRNELYREMSGLTAEQRRARRDNRVNAGGHGHGVGEEASVSQPQNGRDEPRPFCGWLTDASSGQSLASYMATGKMLTAVWDDLSAMASHKEFPFTLRLLWIVVGVTEDFRFADDSAGAALIGRSILSASGEASAVIADPERAVELLILVDEEQQSGGIGSASTITQAVEQELFAKHNTRLLGILHPPNTGTEDDPTRLASNFVGLLHPEARFDHLFLTHVPAWHCQFLQSLLAEMNSQSLPLPRMLSLAVNHQFPPPIIYSLAHAAHGHDRKQGCRNSRSPSDNSAEQAPPPSVHLQFQSRVTEKNTTKSTTYTTEEHWTLSYPRPVWLPFGYTAGNYVPAENEPTLLSHMASSLSGCSISAASSFLNETYRLLVYQGVGSFWLARDVVEEWHDEKRGAIVFKSPLTNLQTDLDFVDCYRRSGIRSDSIVFKMKKIRGWFFDGLVSSSGEGAEESSEEVSKDVQAHVEGIRDYIRWREEVLNAGRRWSCSLQFSFGLS